MQVGNLHMGILYTSGVKTKQVLFCISWVIIPFFSHLETFRATSQHAFINSINIYLNIKRQRSRFSFDIITKVTNQFLVFCHGLPGFGLCLEVVAHLREVALLQVCELGLFLSSHFLHQNITLHSKTKL